MLLTQCTGITSLINYGICIFNMDGGTYYLYHYDLISGYVKVASTTDFINFTMLNSGNGILPKDYKCPTIFLDGSIYKLYANKRIDANNAEIHLFTSSDGINFTDQGNVYTISIVYNSDMAEMCIFKEGGTYYLYFNDFFTTQGCQLLTSTNGTSFTLANGGNTVYQQGTITNVLPDGNGGYIGLMKSAFIEIFYATSSDLINWTNSYLIYSYPKDGNQRPICLTGDLSQGYLWLVDSDRKVYHGLFSDFIRTEIALNFVNLATPEIGAIQATTIKDNALAASTGTDDLILELRTRYDNYYELNIMTPEIGATDAANISNAAWAATTTDIELIAELKAQFLAYLSPLRQQIANQFVIDKTPIIGQTEAQNVAAQALSETSYITDLEARLDELYQAELNAQRQAIADAFATAATPEIGATQATTIKDNALTASTGIDDLILELRTGYDLEYETAIMTPEIGATEAANISNAAWAVTTTDIELIAELKTQYQAKLAIQRQAIANQFVIDKTPEIGQTDAQAIANQALAETTAVQDLTAKLDELYQSLRDQIIAEFKKQAEPIIGIEPADTIAKQALAETTGVNDLKAKLDELYLAEFNRQRQKIIDQFRLEATPQVGTEATESIIAQASDLIPDRIAEFDDMLHTLLQQQLSAMTQPGLTPSPGPSPAPSLEPSPAPSPEPSPELAPLAKPIVIPISGINDGLVDKVIHITGEYLGWSRPKDKDIMPWGLAQTRSDWIVLENKKYVYVTQLSAVFNQRPIEEHSQIEVEGKLRKNQNGFYFQGAKIISVTVPIPVPTPVPTPIGLDSEPIIGPGGEPPESLTKLNELRKKISKDIGNQKELELFNKAKTEADNFRISKDTPDYWDYVSNEENKLYLASKQPIHIHILPVDKKKKAAWWPLALIGGLLFIADNKKKKSNLVFDK